MSKIFKAVLPFVASYFLGPIGGAVTSLLTNSMGGSNKPKSPEAPPVGNVGLAPADPNNATAKAERDAEAEAERRRLAGARGFNATNPTGGLGDTSASSSAVKSLLDS